MHSSTLSRWRSYGAMRVRARARAFPDPLLTSCRLCAPMHRQTPSVHCSTRWWWHTPTLASLRWP